MDTQSSRRGPDASSATALKHLASDAPYTAVFDLAVYPALRNDPALVAELLAVGDVVWRAAVPYRDLLPPAARELTAHEVARDPFLRTVRRELRIDRDLHGFVWADGAVVLSAAQRDRVDPGGWAWWLIMYETARRAPQLAALTEAREAARDKPGSGACRVRA